MTDGQPVVTFWLGRGASPEDFRTTFVIPYAAAGHDIGLHVDYLGADSQERTLAALADGTAPDIVMIPRAGTLAQLVRDGRLADLSTYAWTRRLLPMARALGTHNGQLYGVPRGAETMMLLYDTQLFESEGWQPPRTLPELDRLAAAMMRRGLVPFGAGTADFPASVELYFSLVINHYAGPAAVRDALDGRVPWTDGVFQRATGMLRRWFAEGWFGDRYFVDGWAEGFGRIATGEAAMSPNMTWVVGEIPRLFDDRAAQVGMVPFPGLRSGLPDPLYVFGTGSLLAINAASPHPDAAAYVLDQLFTNAMRRAFNHDLPFDWNLLLTDPDAAGLAEVMTAPAAAIAVALTEAVMDERAGYATWSYLPPLANAVVIDGFRDMVEGVLPVSAYLQTVDEAFRRS